MGVMERLIYDKDDIALMPYILEIMGECIDMRVDKMMDYVCYEILGSDIFEPVEQPLKTMCVISRKLFYSDYAIKEAHINNVIKTMTGFIGKSEILTSEMYEVIHEHCKSILERW